MSLVFGCLIPGLGFGAKTLPLELGFMDELLIKA